MAYFTPPGGAMTAAYGRSLMGEAPLQYYLPSARRTINGLGALRFNRAVARGMYQIPFTEPVPTGRLGMGQDESDVAVDPTMLIGGIGLLAVGMFLLGKKKKGRRRKR